MTNQTPIQEIVEYLQTLAPRFFAERMRGASDSEIDRLAVAAQTRLADSHREFLHYFGGTPTTVLNPFLNDRDFSISMLLQEYADFPSEHPPRVVMFSASEILGELIYLRNGASPADEPAVGDFRYRPEQTEGVGEWVPRSPAGFHSWLRSAAFTFRRSQPEHSLGFNPPWDADKEIWEGDPIAVEQVLTEQGFPLLFQIGDQRCFDRGDVVASLFVTDGSGTIVGDDRGELEAIRDRLLARVPLTFRVNGPKWRMFAPRE